MRRRVVSIFVSTVVALFIAAQLFVAQLSVASDSLRVDETKTRLLLMEDQARVSLAIDNRSATDAHARLKVELLDTVGRVSAAGERDETIAPGQSALVIPVPFAASRLSEQERGRLAWYRLRYRIALSADSIEGIISLSEITPDLFDLEIIGSAFAFDWMRYRARVRTTHPATSRPVRDVAVRAELRIGDDPSARTLKASAVTDAEGFAVVDLDLPPITVSGEAEITVRAARGGYAQEIASDLRFEHLALLRLSVDKPIYQPGQLLHLRVLAHDRFSGRAVADAPVSVRVSDPEGKNIFRSAIKTSEHGIASLDWPIPDNARLGEHLIEVEIEEGKYENSTTGQTVKITRYDLPNFVVTAKADRAYYLPGQNASVEVRADYLFGQAVRRGRVRVVRESERSWNYRDQKWEVTEGDEYKGETDSTGRFTARIRLGEEHDSLKESDYWRFRDITFAAYFTDPTTNRTEQRRFDIRLTKQAIHVYVDYSNNRQSADLPLQFYVTTFYADGSPAECDVAIAEGREDHDEASVRPAGPTLARVKTNRYGVAKVSSLVVGKGKDSDDEPRLIFSARDGLGRKGDRIERFDYDDEEAVIRVETAKTLYRPGEPIRAEITASEPDLAVIVDAVSDSRVIISEVVRLRGGRGFISFPYSDDFKDEVIVAAYARDKSDGLNVGSRTVLYPRDRELKIAVEQGQPSYQPGEEATARISVRSPEGRAVESALGVVVVDKAVEERARTDQEFGAGGGFWSAFVGDQSFAGVSRADLDRLDLSKPLPQGLELVSEVMLNQGNGYYPKVFGLEAERDHRVLFAALLEPQLKPVRDALNKTYNERAEYPADENALRRLLAESGIDFDSLRDPWGDRYRARFSIDRTDDELSFESAGADKQLDTADDFTVTRLSWPYFRPIGEAINRAAADYHARTGAFIRDRATLGRELRRQADDLELPEAIDLDRLRDRWGRAYSFEFGISYTRFTIALRSLGPDPDRAGDDFTIWTSATDYFAETRDRIATALDDYFKSRALFPKDEKELSEALANSGMDRNRLRDPWGSRYYATFTDELRDGERVSLKSQAAYPDALRHRTDVAPVKLHIRHLLLRSAGEDGKQETYDDFDVGRFSRVVSEQPATQEQATQPTRVPVIFSERTGAISGVITDQAGAVISGATVKATHTTMMLSYQARSNDEGRYFLNNLAAGMYQVNIDAANFKSAIYTDVLVNPSSVVRLDAALEPGAVTETVTVMAGNESVLQTDTTQVSNFELKTAQSPRVGSGAKAQLSTPRLREHFPETLLWKPEVVTDAEGRAQLSFKLADNITTWKLAVVASTVDGRIGVAEHEIRAFQPFFVEHDPPAVLTEGDRIDLPIVLRNYLDRAQLVALEIKPEDWFALEGPARRETEVAAGDARRETFSLRATATVKGGKQRVTARGAEAADAVEKPVTVRPDGREVAQTASQLFAQTATLEIDLPATAINNSAQAEIKIYPNLMAHVVESIEAIMQRPYGCAEQTISSTYPSLLALKHYKRGGEDFPPLAQKAQRYLQSGYERLLGYRAESGGFSYWGRGEADLALTAHALRLLADASEFVAVDEKVIESARQWIIKRQQKDGSWHASAWSGGGASIQNAMLTSFVARVLAAPARANADPARQAETKAALKLALDYLARAVDEVDEPYLIACYAMAAADAGSRDRAESARARLRALARDDAGSAYWALETNTPFYGWGAAGSIETTALAVQALAKGCNAQRGDCAQLIDRGLLFLLRQKDRYGVWHSTQATVNVLDALVTLLPREDQPVRRGDEDSAELFVNGRAAQSISLPSSDSPAGPVGVPITTLLSTGKNRIEIRRRAGSSLATAQAIINYYVPWTERRAEESASGKSGLRLGVTFDKTAARVGDEITCKVEAGRAGFWGFGMMLAEIGLPPGAEVDRASLERAVKQANWEINQYDVLPDRVIVYLWPRAGVTRFEFKFRARFGLAAQSAPSLLCDYYNPEARAVIAPARFVISEK
ncbi:MAG TPA: MG2 domain-containing protein [Blastocatellia bacterium]|nr:MG2 domain-containing protein [Blastocatellia bacterium]